MCEEALDVLSAEGSGMLTLVKSDEAPNPMGVSLLGLEAVVPRPNLLSHDLSQAGCAPVHLPSSDNCRILRASSKEIMDLLPPPACYMTRMSQYDATVLSHIHS